MALQRVLIVDNSEDFYNALAEDLGIQTAVKICCGGGEIQRTIQEFQPDGIVFDLTISGADGLSVLEKVHSCGCRAAILATTRFVSDYVMDTLSRVGVGYVMVKPCDTKAVAERIRDMIRHSTKIPEPKQDSKLAISSTLLDLGFSVKRKGYLCVREAILCKQRNPGQSITKELYPEVGKAFDATSQQVEHVIRTAIASAWNSGDRNLWAQFFPENSASTGYRPSNGEFISRMAECIDDF